MFSVMSRVTYLAPLLLLCAMPASAAPARAPGLSPLLRPQLAAEPGEGSEEGEAAAPLLPNGPPKQRMSTVPDEQLPAPKEAQSVKFVVEHRSALNGQHLTVHGVIVDTYLRDKACIPGKTQCGQTSVTVADSSDGGRNKTYDLTVDLPLADKTPYAVGQALDLRVGVSGDRDAVSLRKD